VLVVVGGLPATGKSTIAGALARQTSTPYLRVDRIEQAIVAWSALSHPLGPVGYAVAHALAREQLELGLDLIVECVNPTALTRDAWLGTAEAAGAVLVEVEVICSNKDEHRRRAEARSSDVEGLVKPAWTAIVDREYESWLRKPLVLDSSSISPDSAAQRIASRMASARSGKVAAGSTD
jgi:predicted kinase